MDENEIDILLSEMLSNSSKDDKFNNEETIDQLLEHYEFLEVGKELKRFNPNLYTLIKIINSKKIVLDIKSIREIKLILTKEIFYTYINKKI